MYATTRGMLLLATPPLDDPNFDRSVIYIMEHSAEGAVGVVLAGAEEVSGSFSPLVLTGGSNFRFGFAVPGPGREVETSAHAVQALWNLPLELLPNLMRRPPQKVVLGHQKKAKFSCQKLLHPISEMP